MTRGTHATEVSQVKNLKEIQTTVDTIAKNFDVGTTSLNAISCLQIIVNTGSAFSDYALQVNGKTRFFREALDETDLDPDDRENCNKCKKTL